MEASSATRKAVPEPAELIARAQAMIPVLTARSREQMRKRSILPETMAEMQADLAGEWILVGDPQTNEELEILQGRVLHHSKDRDEIYRMAVALRPMRSAIVYTGQIPVDTAVVL